MGVIPASSASPCLDQQPSREQTSARMEENQGVAHIFGLSTVFLGLCFIMSMGVFYVYHPYKPGIAKCGDPPEIASPGILVVNNMEAVSSCPEDLRLYGIEKRTCHVEDQAWKPAKDQASKCLAN